MIVTVGGAGAVLPQNQLQSDFGNDESGGVGTKVLRSAAQELDEGILNNNEHSEQMNPLASEAQHRPQATAFFAQGLVDTEAEGTQLLNNGENQPVAANEKESDGI